MVEQIYRRNPILRHSHHPLHSPLLPLPYGDIHLPGEEGGTDFLSRLVWSDWVSRDTCALVPGTRSYSTLHLEALKVFSSLQHLEGVADPVPLIQGILQTGQELRPLRDELYCQLIKQTTRPPQPGGSGNLWKILACMSCTFIPTRSILTYLRFHLKRYVLP